MVLDIFTQSYMQRALLASLIVAATAPTIGVLMALKRLSLIGDTLSHTAFAGVALGVLLNVAPTWSALIVTLLSSLGIAKIRQSSRISGDAALAVFFSLGLASGIFLISLSPNFPINLSSLLFGSILLVTWADVWLIAGIGSVTIVTITLLFKEFTHIALDEELAKASGLPVSKLNYLLSMLIGVMVVAAMRIVGILLISALLVIPALTSMQTSKSFKQTVAFSSVYGVVSVVLGISIAVMLNASPGGTIVLVSTILFFMALIFRKLTQQ